MAKNRELNQRIPKLGISGEYNIIAVALAEANPTWLDLFERVNLKAGETCIRSGGRPTLVYFPVAGLISLLVSPLDQTGDSEAGAAWCGNTDIVGVSALLSEAVAGYRAAVDLDAPVWQCSAQAARRVLEGCGASREIVAHYADLALNESYAYSAFSASQPVRDRLAAYIVAYMDITGDDRLPFGHPFIARRLGARRATVSECVQKWQAEGVLAPSKGYERIQVLTPDALRTRVADAWPTRLKHRRAFLDGLG